MDPKSKVLQSTAAAGLATLSSWATYLHLLHKPSRSNHRVLYPINHDFDMTTKIVGIEVVRIDVIGSASRLLAREES